jgi:hypothetical protein
LNPGAVATSELLIQHAPKDFIKEALIKCRKSACLEKLPSEVGDIQGAHFRN